MTGPSALGLAPGHVSDTEPEATCKKTAAEYPIRHSTSYNAIHVNGRTDVGLLSTKALVTTFQQPNGNVFPATSARLFSTRSFPPLCDTSTTIYPSSKTEPRILLLVESFEKTERSIATAMSKEDFQ